MENIIQKVKKMLDLAENDAATEGERENALRMAWAYIRKHNLDMDEVKSHTQEETREDLSDEFYGRPWAKQLCKAVASMFFCKYYTSWTRNKNYTRHHFVGKTSNAVTAQLLSMYLISSIRKEAGKQMRAKGEGASYRNSFSLGASTDLRNRIYQLLKDKPAEDSGTGTSLVLVDVQKAELEANEAFLKTQGVSLVTSKATLRGASDWGAYTNGVGFAKGLSLNTQVAQESQKLLK